MDISRDQCIHLLGVTIVLLRESFQVEKFISTSFVVVKGNVILILEKPLEEKQNVIFFLKIRFNENCISELDSYCGITVYGILIGLRSD